MRKLIIVVALLLAAPSVSANSLFHYWDNYKQTYRRFVKVCAGHNVTVYVNLPASFISENEKTTLFVDIESCVRTAVDGSVIANFEILKPYVSINGNKFLGGYRMPVRDFDNRRVCEVKISRKHLKTGLNSFEFISTIGTAMRLSGSCFGFLIRAMSFQRGELIDPAISERAKKMIARIGARP